MNNDKGCKIIRIGRRKYRWHYAESKATVPIVCIATGLLVALFWICLCGFAAIPV